MKIVTIYVLYSMYRVGQVTVEKWQLVSEESFRFSIEVAKEMGRIVTLVHNDSTVITDPILELAIVSDTKIEKIQTFIEGFREIIQKHPQALHATSNVNLVNIDKGMLEIAYNLFFQKNPSYQRELTYRQEVLSQVLRLAESLEISLKFKSGYDNSK